MTLNDLTRLLRSIEGDLKRKGCDLRTAFIVDVRDDTRVTLPAIATEVDAALRKAALAGVFNSFTGLRVSPILGEVLIPVLDWLAGRGCSVLGADPETPPIERLCRALESVGSDVDGRAPSTAAPAGEAKHSMDFTFVKWYGTEYTFAYGVQSSAVKALWDEWEKTGLGLHQDTIRNAVDPERDDFRMDKAFRNHPAFGTMIQSVGDGRYKLAVPEADTTPGPKQKKSAGIPAKAPRKPR